MSPIKLLTSWFNVGLLISGVSLTLTGCGWTPLYGPSASHTLPALQSVKVDVISDRSGQILRNYLIDALNPQSIPAHPNYRLKVELKETTRALGFRKDATARREELTLTAHIELVDTKTQAVILRDTVTTIGGYTLGAKADIGSFSSIIGEKGAREQALHTLSEDIVLKLADALRYATPTKVYSKHFKESGRRPSGEPDEHSGLCDRGRVPTVNAPET